MVLSTANKRLACSCAWLLLAGCSGGSGFSGGAGKGGGNNDDKQASTSGGPDSSAGSEDDENSKATQPAQVSGAFLTDSLKCAFLDGGLDLALDDSLGTTGTSSSGPSGPMTGSGSTSGSSPISNGVDDTSLIGCGLYDNKSSKVDLSGIGNKLTLLDQNGQAQPMDTVPAPSQSAWHVLANLPYAYKLSGTVDFSITPNTGPREYKLPASQISDSTSDALDTTAAGQLIPNSSVTPVSSSNPSVATQPPVVPTSVAADAIWYANDAAWLGGGINPGDFCSNGTPRSSLGTGSQLAIAGASALGALFKTNISVPETITVEPSPTTIKATCFAPFGNGAFSGHDALVQEGDGCLFLRSMDNLIIISESGINYNATGLAQYAAKFPTCP